MIDAFGPFSDPRVRASWYIAQDECNYRWATDYICVNYGENKRYLYTGCKMICMHTHTRAYPHYVCTHIS